MHFKVEREAHDAEYYYRADETHWSKGVDDYDDPLPGAGPISVSVTRYRVSHHTKCGVVLAYDKRFINNKWTKKFAHPTKEEALKSLIARRERVIDICRHRIRDAELVMQLANVMLTEKQDRLYDYELRFNTKARRGSKDEL